MRTSKKALSLFLAITMIFSIIPNSFAYASEKKVKDSTYHDSDQDSSYTDSGFNGSGDIKDSGVQVTGIKLNKTTLTLENGKSETLIATVSPDDATDKKVFWATSNRTVCTVDQNGKVTAVGNGSAVITVMTRDGGFTAKCNVNVITSITGITISKTNMTLAKGSTKTLIAKVTPEGASYPDIRWSSSDKNICTVDSSGKVSALNVGTAVISVTTKDGGYTATCLVTVIAPVTGVTLNKSELILENGKSETLTATVAPVDATNKGVFWSSSNDAVCTVDKDGKVTATGNGSAVITVTTSDGNFTSKCSVSVNTRVTGIMLNKAKMTLAPDSKETLIATVTPANASQQDVSWFSTDGTVCTVNSSGEVSALSVGTAVIIATTKDGGYSTACIVNVVKPATGVTLNKTELTLENGKSETLIAAVTPSDATDQGISWSSSNKSVCTVDQTGKVTAVNNGSAVITVTTYDGAFTATCKVNVKTSVNGILLNKTKMTLSKGSKETLIATVTPTGASQKDVSWFSSDKTVCTVDSNGTVSSLNGGTAVVYAITKDGGYIASCIITVTTPVTNVTLNKTEVTLENGKTEALTATVNPSDATNQRIFWVSSNNSVCTVDENGNVTAEGNGSAVITVKTEDGGFTVKCKVNVITSVTGITLNKANITLAKGSMETLIATISPAGASQQDILWSSSDEKVCTVDSYGKITALNAGTAEVSATTQDGKYTAKCSVTVVIPVSGIALNKTELRLEKGKSESLSATVTPDDATTPEMVWASSNNTVCAVDQCGKVTAVSNGTAVIRVMTLDGGFTTECSVTVITSATGVTLNKANATLVKGSKDTLKVTVSPSDASNKDVSWSSSDTNVCSVDQTGNLSALNAGTAVITVTTKDGGFTAKCTVTVVIPATGVTLNKANLNLENGKSETLIATVTPADATNQQVLWSTSDSSVCTVDQSGKVTAIGNGTAVITVITKDGGYSANCKLTVFTSVTGITLNKKETTLAKNSKDTLIATVNPSNASNKDVTWSSSDANVCSVDQTGNLSALNAGTAVISVTTKDGEYTAKCTITVVIPVTSITINPSALTLIKGTNGTLSATIAPEDATNKNIIWSSSDSNIATVDSTGKVTAVNVGTATITASTEDGRFTATSAITVKPNTYVVTALASTGGTVQGSGVHEAGSNVTLTAVPDEHYHFVNWTDTNGNVIGTSPTYAINNLSADCTVRANFAIDTFTVNATAGANGTVAGSGTYAYGSTATLTATPNTNYHFISWSDGSTDLSHTITVTQNINLTANFAADIITWTYSCEGNDSLQSVRNSATSSALFDWGSMKNKIRRGTVTYTFSNPIVLPEGSTIVLTSEQSPEMSLGADANFGTLFPVTWYVKTEFGWTTVGGTYTCNNTTTLTSVTIIGVNGGWSQTYLSALLTINIKGGKSFQINSTNTSN